MKEWLDAKPDGALTNPATAGDFRAMLDNAPSLYLNTGFLAEVATDQDTLSAEYWAAYEQSVFGNAMSWSEIVPFQENPDWSSMYPSVFHINVILEGLIKLANNAEVSELRGEALYHRGYFHYCLATAFAQPYDPANPANAFGIPIRTSNDLSVPVARSTVGESYRHILEDLTTATDLLPQNGSEIFRPSRRAAWGLLSRIYLSMQAYDSAMKYADLYLEKYPSLLDFNSLDPAKTFIGLNVEVGSLHYFQAGSLYPFGVPKSLYERYEANDLRSVIYFQVVDGIANFKGSYSRSEMDCYTGVATDEMYLNSAECLARKGEVAKAMGRLNKLLRTRYKVNEGVSTYQDKTAANADQALRIILEEREKELVRRGTRWADLRRLNKDPRFARTLRRTLGNSTYTLEPNSDRYTFPIPRDVINKSGIQQNPGW
ncbi:RagB/SusD family nutrient uptake outer membrane protein [Chitinophaga caseinilytica]|uniref:RagB/SusD family nutrient uptake outer membrane protein n=1 Tax=Chitinophaga caseinilytica TaxID=2267521 RepID=UPI003C2E04AD